MDGITTNVRHARYAAGDIKRHMEAIYSLLVRIENATKGDDIFEMDCNTPFAKINEKIEPICWAYGYEIAKSMPEEETTAFYKCWVLVRDMASDEAAKEA